MNKVPVFVGLDYHQAGIQLCVVDDSGTVLANRRVGNDWRQVAAAAGRWGRVERAAIESCAGAADLAEELVDRAGWSVDLAHPGYVRRMKHSPDKTDYSDARMLADLTRVGYLPRVWLAPHAVRELRRLTRYRQQLVNERRAAKLRITAMLRDQRVASPAGCRRWTRPWLAWVAEGRALSNQGRWIVGRHLRRIEQLAEEIGAVMRRLADVTSDDPTVQHLLTRPGIGPVTACVLRAEIGRFDRFRSAKQLSRFCGVSPRNASSGERQADAGLIRAASGTLRAIVIEAAHRLARFDERWAALACRLRAAGKPGSVVAAAVANRWLRWLYYQMVPTVA